ncbi:MAG: LysE family translocator [Streptomycetales bacterium]
MLRTVDPETRVFSGVRVSNVAVMSWHSYATFVGLALALTLAPGPDFALVVKNSLAGGRRAGVGTSFGVVSSLVVQGTAVAFGLAAVIVRSQTLLSAIRWAGAAYLCYLGVQALRSALRRHPTSVAASEPADRAGPAGSARRGWRQGFLSNITNPKVLAFYVSVLPQFIDPGSALPPTLALALTHAALSLTWWLVLVTVLGRARALVRRDRVRRTLDALSGVVLLGFGARLATEHR